MTSSATSSIRNSSPHSPVHWMASSAAGGATRRCPASTFGSPFAAAAAATEDARDSALLARISTCICSFSTINRSSSTTHSWSRRRYSDRLRVRAGRLSTSRLVARPHLRTVRFGVGASVGVGFDARRPSMESRGVEDGAHGSGADAGDDEAVDVVFRGERLRAVAESDVDGKRGRADAASPASIASRARRTFSRATSTSGALRSMPTAASTRPPVTSPSARRP